jgi:hypothetical protein
MGRRVGIAAKAPGKLLDEYIEAHCEDERIG